MKKILFFLAVSSALMVHGQIINTAAGNGIGGFSGDGGPATSASLKAPIDVAVDNAGNLYIADYDNQRIRKVNTSGIISTFAGNGTLGFFGDGGPATSAEFYNPFGLAFDPAGNLYVADEFNYRIRKISTSGIITTVAGNGVASYSGDGGPATAAEIQLGWEVATDGNGNFFISDLGAERLRKVNTSGIINTVAGNGTYGYTGDGGPATAAELGGLSAATVDAAGNLYLACQNNEALRMVNSAGIINTIAGNGIAGFSGDGGPATAAELSGVFGVKVDNVGNIYLGDQGNERIRFINTSGIISTFAGNGVGGFSGDGGPATSAEISGPNQLALAPGGLVYIVDNQNNRIRVVSGVITDVNDLKFSNEVTIYPNPSNGVFTFQIKSEGFKDMNLIEIYNAFGENIYTSQGSILNSSYSVDLSNQSSGIYFYRIVSGEGKNISSGKIVLQK
jgi:hypothetical protein